MPTPMQLTEQEFEHFAKLVQERAGITLVPAKRTLLSNRLRARLKARGLSSFAEYAQQMRNPRFAEDELPHFLSTVTTNETHFFRNPRLWELFTNKMIPAFRNGRPSATKRIKVWSAASSSGEEAYTVAIALAEAFGLDSGWQVQIVGSDISQRVLDKAQAGRYGEYAVAKMDTARRTRWFNRIDDEYEVKPELRKMVRFMTHDLRRPFPLRGFNLVLLRNVLMYFDNDTKRQALETCVQAVAPEGFLFVGDVDPIRTTPELTASMPFKGEAPGLY